MVSSLIWLKDDSPSFNSSTSEITSLLQFHLHFRSYTQLLKNFYCFLFQFQILLLCFFQVYLIIIEYTFLAFRFRMDSSLEDIPKVFLCLLIINIEFSPS